MPTQVVASSVPTNFQNGKKCTPEYSQYREHGMSKKKSRSKNKIQEKNLEKETNKSMVAQLGLGDHTTVFILFFKFTKKSPSFSYYKKVPDISDNYRIVPVVSCMSHRSTNIIQVTRKSRHREPSIVQHHMRPTSTKAGSTVAYSLWNT